MPPYSGDDSVITASPVRNSFANFLSKKKEQKAAADDKSETQASQSSSKMSFANFLSKKEQKPTDDNSESQGSQSPSKMSVLLDFNPCTSVSSAVFKTRTCKHCGKGCNKLRGYDKEVKEDENGETIKVHVHKWCSQLLEWKAVHSVGWKKVMDGLLGHFRAIALAEQRRKEAEERARREAMQKAAEARRKAEEERQARLEEQRQREAEEEAARVAAAEAQARKERSLTYKLGKALSALTKGCKGNQNKAVDEDATERSTK